MLVDFMLKPDHDHDQIRTPFMQDYSHNTRSETKVFLAIFPGCSTVFIFLLLWPSKKSMSTDDTLKCGVILGPAALSRSRTIHTPSGTKR